MNIHDKGFDRANQELIDRYVDRLKYKSHLLDDDSLRSFKPAYRKSSFPEWIGRNMYYPFHRYDVMYYSKKDIKMTKIRRMNIINFNIILPRIKH